MTLDDKQAHLIKKWHTEGTHSMRSVAAHFTEAYPDFKHNYKLDSEVWGYNERPSCCSSQLLGEDLIYLACKTLNEKMDDWYDAQEKSLNAIYEKISHE